MNEARRGEEEWKNGYLKFFIWDYFLLFESNRIEANQSYSVTARTGLDGELSRECRDFLHEQGG